MRDIKVPCLGCGDTFLATDQFQWLRHSINCAGR